MDDTIDPPAAPCNPASGGAERASPFPAERLLYRADLPPFLRPPAEMPRLALRALPIAGLLLVAACTATPPTHILGDFVDDYGTAHTLTATRWAADGRPEIAIEWWVPGEEYFLTRSDDGLWTRVDWVMLDDPAWPWGFCITSWDQPSPEEAVRVGRDVADRERPREGCNGSPFTRMGPNGERPPTS